MVSGRLLLFISVGIGSGLLAQSRHAAPKAQAQKGFIENKGQIVDQNYIPNKAVKYLLCQSGLNVQLRQTGFSYDTYTEDKPQSQSALLGRLPKFVPVAQKQLYHFHRVDIELVGCNPSATVLTEGESKTYFNYFTTGTPREGVTRVHRYSAVKYENIYPHIDLVFKLSDSGKAVKGNFEYNFIIHPGGNIADIKLAYRGANNVTLADNKLVVNVAAGDFTENIPNSYLSTKQPVSVGYTALGNNTYGFSILDSRLSDLNADLIIDPTPCLLWGTYFGGTGFDYMDYAHSIAIGEYGDIYAVGWTTSLTNIATLGSYQTTLGGSQDVFVADLDSSGIFTWWVTYYGGTSDEYAAAIVLDSNYNVYVAGGTSSTNAIATPGAYQTTLNSGSQDCFIAKFDPSGSSLLWGTYYGGSVADGATDIKLDANYNVYITGFTTSTSHIATPGAYQTTYGGGAYDILVAKFNPTGSSLLWGTYYGGSDDDYGFGLALDASDNVYVAGSTASTNMATVGSYEATYNGGTDVCVAKFNPTGTSLLWGTYYGGTGDDEPSDLLLDANNNIFICGQTSSTTGIATPGAYQTVYGGGNIGGNLDGFIANFNSTGTALKRATYYGGRNFDACTGMALTLTGELVVCGTTLSVNNISTPGAYKPDGDSVYEDGFVAEFDTAGPSLRWGTYYGGNSYDGAVSVAVDNVDYIYIGGWTSSTDSIATAGTYQTTYAGTDDVYIAALGCACVAPPNQPVSIIGPSGVCPGSTNTYKVAPVLDAINYTWTLPAGWSGTSTADTIAVTAGATADTIYVIANNNCGSSIAQKLPVDIVNSLSVTITAPTTICSGVRETIAATGGGTYSWSTTATTSSIIVSPNTFATYTVHIVNGTCSKDTGTTVSVNPSPTVTVSNDTTICSGAQVTLKATGGGTYSWNSGATSTSGSILVTPASSNTYSVQVSLGTCSKDTSVHITVNPSPTVTVSHDTTICSGVHVTLNATGGGTYSWSGGVTSTASSVSVTPLSTNTYSLQVSLGTCFKDTTVVITVDSAPVPAISLSQTICSGTSVPINASGGSTYLWSPSAGLSSTTLPNPVADPVQNTTYTVVIAKGPCVTKDSVTITVNQSPTIVACCDTSLIIGQSTKLLASGGARYSWIPATGLSCTECADPIASPVQNTTYTVTGTASDGCSEDREIVINVGCADFEVPNIFTPNNDGINDDFVIPSQEMSSYSITIVDRWGRQVFTTTDVNTYWNGTDPGGVLVSSGVYYYSINAECGNGQSYNKKGFVQVLR